MFHINKKKLRIPKPLILPGPSQLIQCIVTAQFPALSSLILKSVLKKLFVFRFSPCRICKPTKQYAAMESLVEMGRPIYFSSSSNSNCEALRKSFSRVLLPHLHI